MEIPDVFCAGTDTATKIGPFGDEAKWVDQLGAETNRGCRSSKWFSTPDACPKHKDSSANHLTRVGKIFCMFLGDLIFFVIFFWRDFIFLVGKSRFLFFFIVIWGNKGKNRGRARLSRLDLFHSELFLSLPTPLSTPRIIIRSGGNADHCEDEEDTLEEQESARIRRGTDINRLRQLHPSQLSWLDVVGCANWKPQSTKGTNKDKNKDENQLKEWTRKTYQYGNSSSIKLIDSPKRIWQMIPKMILYRISMARLEYEKCWQVSLRAMNWDIFRWRKKNRGSACLYDCDFGKLRTATLTSGCYGGNALQCSVLEYRITTTFLSRRLTWTQRLLFPENSSRNIYWQK